MTTFTIGSKAVPLPIHLDLKVITEALDKNWWGGENEWKNKSIDKKQSNLLKALKEYPKYIHAKKNTGEPLTSWLATYKLIVVMHAACTNKLNIYECKLRVNIIFVDPLIKVKIQQQWPAWRHICIATNQLGLS